MSYTAKTDARSGYLSIEWYGWAAIEYVKQGDHERAYGYARQAARQALALLREARALAKSRQCTQLLRSGSIGI